MVSRSGREHGYRKTEAERTAAIARVAKAPSKAPAAVNYRMVVPPMASGLMGGDDCGDDRYWVAD